jgi:translation elongation factor EF-Tu-like GTPase
MPIEIRELVIRATVEGGENPRQESAAKREQNDQQQIIEECIEQILKILDRKSER